MDQVISVVDQVDATSADGGSKVSRGGSPNAPLLVGGKPIATGRVDLPQVNAAVRHMVRSVEPSRMFSELARVCVPAISDACTIDLVEEGGHRYRIRQPAENPYGARGFAQQELVAEADFSSDGAGGPRFSGVLTCIWFDGYRSGEADAALFGLLVDHTTALVEHERLTVRVGELQTAPGNAVLMLPSHQRVAAAVGILMVLHHLTATQATDLLTRASQHTHLSIRGVADTVLRTGAMPDHPHPAPAPV